MNINSCTIVGRISLAPVGRKSANGSEFTVLNLVVNYTGNDGVEHPTYVKCLSFGKQGAACLQWLEVGQTVAVEGRLSSSREVINGQAIWSVCVIANRVEFGPKSKASSAQPTTGDSFELDVEPEVVAPTPAKAKAKAKAKAVVTPTIAAPAAKGIV